MWGPRAPEARDRRESCGIGEIGSSGIGKRFRRDRRDNMNRRWIDLDDDGIAIVRCKGRKETRGTESCERDWQSRLAETVVSV